ncbi:M15 family metallopeptidase [Aeromicrobium yanjiei]|uniref:Peptidase M15C domain-containing protein n=1 Tax=Aeromicrobium yanjiei TaxID=2662028 RepID=A0A5Q2MJG2_9ACTN|nr:M15 family metallopeptidase [Aeromicrobium yanjiei]QGG42848.1 hypothetical protein GEV26_16515 [Aeromicrobium yanjiei]
MKIATSVSAGLVSAALTLSVMPPAGAAPSGDDSTTLQLSVPASTPAGADVTATAILQGAAGGIPDAPVTLFRGRPDDDVPDTQVAAASTDAEGVATLTADGDRSSAYSSYYARFDGDDTRAAAVSDAQRTQNEGVAASTTTTLEAAASTKLRRPITLTATVAGAGEPAAIGVVRFEQQSGSDWAKVADVTVTGAGTATTSVVITSARTVLRARYLGVGGYGESTSAPHAVSASRQTTTATLTAPSKVVDEQRAQLSAQVRTEFGALPGAKVSFQHYKDGRWTTFSQARTSSSGVAKASPRPRRTYWFRIKVASSTWQSGDTSAKVRVRNVPPGKVIKRLAGSPKPRSLPAQSRASGSGANAKVSKISAKTWKSMKGRSWRSGCPVGRSSLRVVKVNYWGFDGYRHRGEIVVHKAIGAKTARLFTDLYTNKVSIRAMYRVDRFGYSSRVRGANDYASMAADNTSAFNCRNVVGRPGVRSPHAYGRAIDINPFENPYLAAGDGWVPNAWWRTRAAGTYAWTKSSHLVPRIMKRNGFRWTYGLADGHHFDG